MKRFQVYLREDQHQALRRRSAATGESVSALVRCGVELALRIERAIAVTGLFSSGRRDVSTRHDRYLAVAFD